MQGDELLALLREIDRLKQEEDRKNEYSAKDGAYSSRVRALENKVRALRKSGAPALPSGLDRGMLVNACHLVGPSAVHWLVSLFEAARGGSDVDGINLAVHNLLPEGTPWPGGAAHVPLLRACVNHSSVEVREAAVRTLMAIGPAAVADCVPQLIQALSHSHLCWKAAEALAMAGPAAAAATPALQKLLGTEAASPASAALAAIGARDALPGIAKSLDAPYSHDRRAAAEAVGKLGGEASISLLRELLSEEWNEEVRRAAASAILKLRGEPRSSKRVSTIDLAHPPLQAARAILRRLASKTDEGRRDAMRAMLAFPDIRPREAIPLIADGMEDTNFFVEAVDVLSSYGPAAAAAVPGLVKWMRHSVTGYDREMAAKALGLIAGPEAIEALQEFDRSFGPKESVSAAIAAIRARAEKRKA
ncbi:MAG TPA: HEAT repeat domain-containing protein [Planctomycetota bacterium]